VDADQGFMFDRLRMELGLDSGWLVSEVVFQDGESRVMVTRPDQVAHSFTWEELYASKDPTQLVRDRFAE
jgi:hypothetical protein